MAHQINNSEERKTAEENQVEMMEVKCVTEVKNSLEGLKSWKKVAADLRLGWLKRGRKPQERCLSGTADQPQQTPWDTPPKNV